MVHNPGVRLQELDVAVSLSLFVSRMAEMGTRVNTTLAALPAALSAGAHAASSFSSVFRPAAAATAAASASHGLAQDLNVSSVSNSRSPLASHVHGNRVEGLRTQDQIPGSGASIS